MFNPLIISPLAFLKMPCYGPVQLIADRQYFFQSRIVQSQVLFLFAIALKDVAGGAFFQFGHGVFSRDIYMAEGYDDVRVIPMRLYYVFGHPAKLVVAIFNG